MSHPRNNLGEKNVKTVLCRWWIGNRAVRHFSLWIDWASLFAEHDDIPIMGAFAFGFWSIQNQSLADCYAYQSVCSQNARKSYRAYGRQQIEFHHQYIQLVNNEFLILILFPLEVCLPSCHYFFSFHYFYWFLERSKPQGLIDEPIAQTTHGSAGSTNVRPPILLKV